MATGDEIILFSDAENDFVGIERLTDKELEELHTRCEKAAERSQAMLNNMHAERKARKSRQG